MILGLNIAKIFGPSLLHVDDMKQETKGDFFKYKLFY